MIAEVDLGEHEVLVAREILFGHVEAVGLAFERNHAAGPPDGFDGDRAGTEADLDEVVVGCEVELPGMTDRTSGFVGPALVLCGSVMGIITPLKSDR